jgi:hypothetical protein
MGRKTVIETLAVFDKPLASKACSALANFASARARGLTINCDTISSSGEIAEGDIARADVLKGPVEPAGAAVAIAIIKATVAVTPGKVWRIICIFKISLPEE